MGSLQAVPVVVLDSIVSRTVSGVLQAVPVVVLDSIVSRTVRGVFTGSTCGCAGQYCQ